MGMKKELAHLELVKYMENVSEFQNELDDISKTWDQLILLSQLGATGIDMSQTKMNFNDLTTELITHLSKATIDKVKNEMQSKAQVAVDIVIRNLFERTADIGFLATDDDIRNFLVTLPQIKGKLKEHRADEDDTQFRIAKQDSKKLLENMRARFEEYVAKYSVYFEIVLFDANGYCVATLDEKKKIKKTNSDIIELSKVTSEDYIETYQFHDFVPEQEKSLVYTYKVTSSNESDEIIGYLSLCFKFEDEMEGIFSRLIDTTNKETILLLDKDGVAIASSDKYHIPVGAKLDTEIEKDFKLTQFAGRDYIVTTCKTNGYEGFFGLGWLGHIMIPIESAFNTSNDNIEIDDTILYSIMKNEELFQKDLLEIPLKAEHIQNELDRAVWNGNVSQMDTHTNGADFARSILREVRQTGELTKKSFNTSIEKLNQTIISSLIDNAKFLATLSIDIMDRNLYERANDCRWWALTSTFKELLGNGTLNIDDSEKITSILKYINELYTVYTNLFIYDKDGIIIAVSNDKERNIIGSRLSNSWVGDSLNLKDSSKYTVSGFESTFLYNNNHTYVYNAAITDLDGFKNIGGIGVVFDSTPQFKDMLKDALPQIDGEVKNGIFSLFVEKNTKKIISCSDEHHIVGENISIDDIFFKLNNGETSSIITQYNGKYYIVGGCCSTGYREYKSNSDDYVNDVLALVFIEAGEICDEIVQKEISEDNYYTYQIGSKDEVEEIATFYIGDKWLGVKQSEIVEAISVESLESAISLEKDHHFKGTVSYKNMIVSVLDISPFVKNTVFKSKSEIVLVKYKGSMGDHTIGILVDKLGEIMKVPKNNIKAFEKHLIGGGMLGESIVQPPEGSTSQNLLTLLNISKIGELNE
jgi:chemotaxis signal transduction protein